MITTMKKVKAIGRVTFQNPNDTSRYEVELSIEDSVDVLHGLDLILEQLRNELAREHTEYQRLWESDAKMEEETSLRKLETRCTSESAALRSLGRSGIKTIEELRRTVEKDGWNSLLALRNIGPARLKQLKEIFYTWERENQEGISCHKAGS